MFAIFKAVRTEIEFTYLAFIAFFVWSLRASANQGETMHSQDYLSLHGVSKIAII